MRALVLLIALLLTPALLAIAHASPCDGDGHPALGIAELRSTLGHIFYVDDRNFVNGYGIWIYEETNAVYGDDPDHSVAPAHLQRGGSVCADFFPCPEEEVMNAYDPCVDPRPDGTDPDQLHEGGYR